MSSVPRLDILSLISMMPCISHDKKFCRSSSSSASHIGSNGCDGDRPLFAGLGSGCSDTGRSCCSPPVPPRGPAPSWLSPTSWCAALVWSQVLLALGLAVLHSVPLMLGGPRLSVGRSLVPVRPKRLREIGGSTKSGVCVGVSGGMLDLCSC